MQFVAHLRQLETDMRMSRAETSDQVWHEPGTQRVLEGECHGAGVRFDELVDGGDPVVELVQQGIDMPLEYRARVSQPEGTAGPAQQRGADLRLQAPQST